MSKYKKFMCLLAFVVMLTEFVYVTGTSPAGAVEILDHVVKNPADVPPPVSRRHPTVVEVDLIAQEVVAELAPGKRFWFWTFNGTVPGPMIRVREGDTVVINVINHPENVEPHSIDLHAVIGPGGGHAVTEVEPGQTKTLTFKALKEGAYIYHCAAEGMPWEHVAYGMYGLIVVEPKNGLRRVDREFYVAQGEWYLRHGMDEEEEEGEEHELPEDVYSLDEEKAMEEHPDYFTFNGHTKALTEIYADAMTVNQGDNVRIFFVSAGPNKGSNFHIIGQIFDRVYSGHHRTFIRNEETVYVPPGSATILEFKALVPGEYTLIDHALFRVPRGAAGLLHVNQLGSWPSDIYSPEP